MSYMWLDTYYFSSHIVFPLFSIAAQSASNLFISLVDIAYLSLIVVLVQGKRLV